MKALVYHSPGRSLFEDRPLPVIEKPTDAIVKVTNATVCGSDLPVLRGDAASIAHGRILGHEGTGIIERVGDGVFKFRVGDCVLISCLTLCGTCGPCENGDPAHCENGGWILGNAIDGTHAEYVRVPFADHSLFPLVGAGDDNTDGPWIDNFPGGFTRGVFHGPDEDGDTAPILFGGSVGMGPLLSVMEYYRTVVRPISRTNGSHYFEARVETRERTTHNTRRSLGNQLLHYFAPIRTR